MWDIIIVVVAAILLIGLIILVSKANYQFRDKSLEVKEGMNEEQVLEIMGKDPISTDTLKGGKYKWTFERKDYKGWGYKITTSDVYFDENGKVTLVERNVTYDRPGMKKQ